MVLKKVKPAPTPKKDSNSKAVWKFLMKVIAVLALIFFTFNGFVDVVEGTFYSRYTHYFEVFSGQKEISFKSFFYKRESKLPVNTEPLKPTIDGTEMEPGDIDTSAMEPMELPDTSISDDELIVIPDEDLEPVVPKEELPKPNIFTESKSLPEALEEFIDNYPVLDLYGTVSNPYFLGTDGFKCEILDRDDMNKSACTNKIKAFENLKFDETSPEISSIE